VATDGSKAVPRKSNIVWSPKKAAKPEAAESNRRGRVERRRAVASTEAATPHHARTLHEVVGTSTVDQLFNQTNISRKMSGVVSRLRSGAAGDYSRYLPTSARKLAGSGFISPSERAQLTVARRPDVALHDRVRLCSMIHKFEPAPRAATTPV